MCQTCKWIPRAHAKLENCKFTIYDDTCSSSLFTTTLHCLPEVKHTSQRCCVKNDANSVSSTTWERRIALNCSLHSVWSTCTTLSNDVSVFFFFYSFSTLTVLISLSKIVAEWPYPSPTTLIDNKSRTPLHLYTHSLILPTFKWLNIQVAFSCIGHFFSLILKNPTVGSYSYSETVYLVCPQIFIKFHQNGSWDILNIESYWILSHIFTQHMWLILTLEVK